MVGAGFPITLISGPLSRYHHCSASQLLYRQPMPQVETGWRAVEVRRAMVAELRFIREKHAESVEAARNVGKTR